MRQRFSSASVSITIKESVVPSFIHSFILSAILITQNLWWPQLWYYFWEVHKTRFQDFFKFGPLVPPLRGPKYKTQSGPIGCPTWRRTTRLGTGIPWGTPDRIFIALRQKRKHTCRTIFPKKKKIGFFRFFRGATSEGILASFCISGPREKRKSLENRYMHERGLGQHNPIGNFEKFEGGRVQKLPKSQMSHF